jgi:crotonobetainyl-CoA:carnitine CoA-transferase CaiB-like acyl-CoA transferase
VQPAWAGTVSDRDGALVMQKLSASFLSTPAAADTRPRYRDPYTVSFSPIMRFHRARDGWVFIAAVSRHMWHTLFGLMGHSDLLQDSELDAELPFNVADQAQGERLAAPVLSGREFLVHPQAAANGLPVEVHDELGTQRQVGRFVQCTATEAAASPLGALADVAAGPLHGVRVIDVSRAAAGPICGRVLADLGAEVVRVEDPAGEYSRQVGLTFAANNRNKLSLGVDLTRPEGLDLLARLTEQSDVVLTNALPEASARLGIDYATMAARNPSASHISILGFGRRPPFGGRRVVDAAAQALARRAFAAVLAAADVRDTGREVHGPAATALARALAELTVGGARELFGRAGFADWTVVRTLEEAARDGEDFVGVPQKPWGFLRQPRLLPRYDGDQRPDVAGAAGAPGRDDAAVLRRYGLTSQYEALLASGAMRREPGPTTLQASSV